MATVASIFLLMFFIGGVVNHSFGFAGLSTTKPILWHGFNILICKLSVLAVLSKKPLGYWWLLMVFITEIPVETKGAIHSYGSHLFIDQIIEVALNITGLALVLLTKKSYFSTT